MEDKKLFLEQKQAELDDYGVKLKELQDDLSAYDAEANRVLEAKIKIIELKLKEGKIKLEAMNNASKEQYAARKKAADDAFMELNTHFL